MTKKIAKGTKFGPPPGIMITNRDLDILRLLKYGCFTREKLFKSVWFKDPKYIKGGQIYNNDSVNIFASPANFKKRLNKLVKYGYINQEYIPNINPYTKGPRTVILLGKEGIRVLNEHGEENTPSVPPKISPHIISHSLMVTDANKRLNEDIKNLDKYIAYHYEIKNEYEIRRDNKGQKRGAVYPDLSLLLTLIGKNLKTGEEVRSLRVIHIEIDGSSISPRDYVKKIAALASSPIIMFEERLDKHVVYVLSNDRKRIDSLMKVVRYNKQKIYNYENIGFAIFHDVIRYGFFPLFMPNVNTIFTNCNNEEVNIIRKDEI